MQVREPLALLAELTHACPLKCAYCSNPLELVRGRDELETATWKRVLREAAGLGVLQAHFSGGEPLVREDLEELVREAAMLGLYPFLVTSGVPGGARRLASLHDAGLHAVQISVQHAVPAESDRLAGASSFGAKREAVETAKRLGMHVTLNVVLHGGNLDFVEDLVGLAAAWRVDKLELAHAQHVGWGHANRHALRPSRDQVERARAAADAARREQAFEIVHVLPEWFLQHPRACMHGWGSRYLVVAPDGVVLPCQSAREIEGLELESVRERPLGWIWRDSSAFRRFRGTEWMREPCRSCELRELDLGGCRCRAFRITRDAAATDPACSRSPHRERFDQDLPDAPAPLTASAARGARSSGSSPGSRPDRATSTARTRRPRP
jgi:PqqA peptide cyclase